MQINPWKETLNSFKNTHMFFVEPLALYLGCSYLQTTVSLFWPTKRNLLMSALRVL